MSPDLSLVHDATAGGDTATGGALDVALIADRLGWEDKAILTAARARGARAEWLDDGALCCGSRDDLPQAGAYLIRSRSFVRGPLIAATIEGGDEERVINPARVIDLCSNKVTALATLRDAGLATVPYRLVLTRTDLEAALDAIGVPLVLKPVFGGLGRRVLLVRERSIADATFDYVEHYGQNFDRALIAQPYLDGASDVRVLAIGGTAVAAMERVASGDWRANVDLGAAATPIDLDDATRELTAAVGERIGARIFGLDLFRWGDDLLIGEVNHAPLFKGIADATGIDVAALIADEALGVAAK